MKPLPITFISKGFVHEQLERDGNAAIYRRKKPGQPEHFEAIRIRSHNGYTIAGNHIPPAEVYPPSEKWGHDGFTLLDLESATAKFNELKKP